MYIELPIDIQQEDLQNCNTGIHSLFRHLTDMSKLQAPEE